MKNTRLSVPRGANLHPRLRSSPWWNPAEIPAAALLEKNYETIRNEFLNVLLCGLLRLHPQSKGGPGKQVADGNWNIFELFSRGGISTQNAPLAPHSIRVLRQLLDVTTHPCGFAYFSVLGPHVHIAPHCGPTDSRIRIHLALRVPAGAVMRVGHETRPWKEGFCSVFDDSWEHEVINKSDFFRAVLLVDVWHPDLTEAQRAKLVSRVSARERYEEKLKKGRKGWLNLRLSDAAPAPLASLVGRKHLAKMAASAAKTSGAKYPVLSTLGAFASESMQSACAIPVAGREAITAADCRELWAALASLAAERPHDFLPDDWVNIIHLGCAWWRSWPGNEQLLWRFMKRVEPEARRLSVPARVRSAREVLEWGEACGEMAPFPALAGSAVVGLREVRPPRQDQACNH
jgi:aspartyl/asparaginyl beta-hydroxylase (cupin superfamily)